jgi:hypothetical protein
MAAKITYREFKETFPREAMKFVPPEFDGRSLTVQEFDKNNGPVEMITLTPEEGDGASIAPALRMKELYMSYRSSESPAPLGETAGLLWRSFRQARTNKDVLGTIPENWDKAKQNIYPYLINAEANAKLLETAPHKEVFDLAVAYYWQKPNEQTGELNSILLTDAVLKYFGATERDRAKLYDTAMENLKRDDPPKFYNVLEILPIPPAEDEPNMYALTTKNGNRGAIVITDKKFMDSLREQWGDFYILPSSIHECLAISEADVGRCINGIDFLETIRQVNQDAVNPEERLSGSLYHYGEDGLTIAEEAELEMEENGPELD